jgi:tight adherence protein B
VAQGPTPGVGASILARLRRSRPDGGDAEALAVVQALALQVRAGASPEAAWRQVVEVVVGESGHEPAFAGPLPATGWSTGGAAAHLGPSGAAASGPAWRAIGAAWQLSEQTGAPLADVLERLAVGLRQEAEVAAEVEAALAAPRATSRLLAGLPLVGVALGELIGARPVAVLLGTPLGRVCALAGLVLAGVGQLWTRALVARVDRAAGAG